MNVAISQASITLYIYDMLKCQNFGFQYHLQIFFLFGIIMEWNDEEEDWKKLYRMHEILFLFFANDVKKCIKKQTVFGDKNYAVISRSSRY